jgi:hypothetical protein
MYKKLLSVDGTTDQGIIRLADMAGIPIDNSNVDYLEYVEWLFQGNTAEEWQPETGVEN